jgi:DNA helicase HerA-like ATPase
LLGYGNVNGVKVVDFSEVPSDILPLITGLMGRLIFTIQQWTDTNERHPIAIFCDEAHLYLPVSAADSMDERGLKSFERIAKEGRKYGVSLVVISQRPADVSKTILSQCGNFIAMRLTNPEDQNVIRRLFPDNLGDFAGMLPILDVGEGLVVGDASLLPSRVILDKPTIQPNSCTVDFWDIWNEDKKSSTWEKAVNAMRQQQKL